METRTLYLTLAFASCLGCERGAPDLYGVVKPAHPAGEIWLNNGTEAEYIDPTKCSESAGGTVVRNLFAGLTQLHPKTLTPMPDIARRWVVADEGRRFTFYLRDAVWSDGAPLTAHDFEWSWKRVLDPTTGSKYATFLWTIRHAEAVNLRALRVDGIAGATLDDVSRWSGVSIEKIDHRGEYAFVYVAGTPDEKVVRRTVALAALNQREGVEARQTALEDVGVRALDATTLEVNLEFPAPYFLNATAFYTMRPAPRHVIDGLSARGVNPDAWTRPEHIVSNGAYVLREWKFRQYLLLAKNPRYWDVRNTRNERVRLLLVDSSNAAINLYKAGVLDYIGENTVLPSEYQKHLSEYSDYHRSPFLAVYFYWLNTEKPPMDNPAVRKALSLAIDRRAITDYVKQGGETPTASLVPDGLAGYGAIERPLFAPERAAKILADAGYPGGEGLPAIRLIYNTDEGHRQIAEAVQRMWMKHLGVEVVLDNLEWKVYQKELNARDFQMARMGWVGDYADPYTFLELFKKDNDQNRSNWGSNELDALLDDANRNSKPRDRLRLLRQAEERILDADPIIPFYVYSRNEMWKPYLKGIWPNLHNQHPFKTMWVDERWRDGVPYDDFEDVPPPVVENGGGL